MENSHSTQRSSRRSFWIELALALVSFALLLLTLAWPEWIEGLFGLDPDAGSGAAEWAVAAAFAISSAVWGLRARSHRRTAFNRA